MYRIFFKHLQIQLINDLTLAFSTNCYIQVAIIKKLHRRISIKNILVKAIEFFTIYLVLCMCPNSMQNE